MGLFFIYILKASVCLALFYLFYKVLLSKETFHRFNRMALLGTVVLSFFLPAIKIAVSEPTALNRTVSDLESLLMLAELHAEAGTTETVSRVGWQEAAVGIYLIGIVFFCLNGVGERPARRLHTNTDARASAHPPPPFVGHPDSAGVHHRAMV